MLKFCILRIFCSFKIKKTRYLMIKNHVISFSQTLYGDNKNTLLPLASGNGRRVIICGYSEISVIEKNKHTRFEII